MMLLAALGWRCGDVGGNGWGDAARAEHAGLDDWGFDDAVGGGPPLVVQEQILPWRHRFFLNRNESYRRSLLFILPTLILYINRVPFLPCRLLCHMILKKGASPLRRTCLPVLYTCEPFPVIELTGRPLHFIQLFYWPLCQLWFFRSHNCPNLILLA